MEIRRSRSEQLITQVQIQVQEAGWAMLDHAWDFENSCLPFSRLYFVHDGGGYVFIENQTTELKPGFFYLIPPGINISYRCDQFLEKVYFHFTITMPDGMDLFDGVKECLVLPIEPGESTNLVNWYLGSSLSDSFYVLQVLYGAVARSCEISSAKNRLCRRYSPLMLNAFAQMQKMASIKLTTRKLAKILNVSESTLSKRFHTEAGISFGDYKDYLIMQKACTLLLHSELSISEIADQMDFCDQFYFSRYFKQHQGETPSQYRAHLKNSI